MKLKKVKKLLWAINELCKRPIDSVKGLVNTGALLDDKHPLILIPTRGKYLLPEVRVINKIVMSLDVKKLIKTSISVNKTTGMNLMTVFKDPRVPGAFMVLIHTPYGCCMYQAAIDDINDIPELKEQNIQVDLDDDDIKDKYQIL